MKISILLAKLKNCFEISSGKSGASPSPYSADSAPNLGSKHLPGGRFSSESVAKTVLEKLAQLTGLDFCHAGLNKFVLRSNKCLNRFDDTVEK
ncbi:hypothetical protein AVEN_126642-1 [Araneus ventricosus]|uniref:Uncharacterized protein n=1 Tax=Araneus ventricosus TaxID=182803 RepID=A0A4Y1ZW91_ARAVE|nr:hypothetical protein AVEN_126642-1 [Araneus ventricosus]